MTKISFGDQHDKSDAKFKIDSASDSRSEIQIGSQFDESTRDVALNDAGGPSLPSSIANKPPANLPRPKRAAATHRDMTLMAFGSALIFIATILTLVVLIKNPSALQAHIFLAVLALAAGGFSSALPGLLNVKMRLSKRLVIGATGALAVFVIVYFFVPGMAQ
jgi:hypothetical protein